MKLQHKSGPVTLTLELKESPREDITPAERKVMMMLVANELELIVKALAHQLNGILNMGPLQPIGFDMLKSSLDEAGKDMIEVIQSVEAGKDPMDILAEYLEKDTEGIELPGEDELSAFTDFLKTLVDTDPDDSAK